MESWGRYTPEPQDSPLWDRRSLQRCPWSTEAPSNSCLSLPLPPPPTRRAVFGEGIEHVVGQTSPIFKVCEALFDMSPANRWCGQLARQKNTLSVRLIERAGEFAQHGKTRPLSPTPRLLASSFYAQPGHCTSALIYVSLGHTTPKAGLRELGARLGANRLRPPPPERLRSPW